MSGMTAGSDARIKFARMPFDLGDDAAGFRPASRLIRGVALTTRPRERTSAELTARSRRISTPTLLDKVDMAASDDETNRVEDEVIHAYRRQRSFARESASSW
jgi:hypothetical protein